MEYEVFGYKFKTYKEATTWAYKEYKIDENSHVETEEEKQAECENITSMIAEYKDYIHGC